MHKPVLVKEVIKFLNPQRNQNFIDATYGFGGHSKELLKYIKPKGKILAFEWDPFLVELNKKNLMQEKNIILKNANFTKIKKIVKELNFTKIKGVIFDLGISSWHLENSKRGFSFNKDKFLDMRINPKEIKITAFEVVNYYSKERLIEILKNYGEKKTTIDNLPSYSKNTTIAITGIFENSVCCYTNLGEKGKRAEVVAEEACEKFLKFISSDSAIDEYMAHQILLPLSIANDVSEFTTSKITNHLKTNMDTIKKFLDVDFEISELGEAFKVKIKPAKIDI